MRPIATILLLSALSAVGQNPPAPALTIYNQNFGVIRQTVRLDLKAGTNDVRFDDVTAQLEPDSVVLRDPSGKRALQILEQNYQADPVSQTSLLKLFQGQTIGFAVSQGEGKAEIAQGRIVRPGTPPGQPCYPPKPVCLPEEPLIEMDGKLMFGLPGRPLFPALPQDTNLKPTLAWVLEADRGGPLDAELSYITEGMTWEADYNVIAPADGNLLDLIGWVTMDNRSGKTFEHARIQLMAGDVNKIQPTQYGRVSSGMGGGIYAAAVAAPGPPPVTEKPFDEYHLYTLERPTTLRDRETKQVEFVRANSVTAKRIYVYDGSRLDPARLQQNWDYMRMQRNLGVSGNTKVWVMQEFKNSQQNHLGIPLPKGRLRIYRRDESGALQFVGENNIDHTPKDETIRVYTGNAFDLAGERRSTDFKVDSAQRWIDETFEIKVRNHKKQPADVTIVEHLYRATNWEITSASSKYTKKDSNTIEFAASIPPDGEQTVICTVHYSW